MAVTLKGQTAVYEGTSTDTKPTDADNNAIFKELDTGIRYYYDGTDWNEIPRSGGGGGGGTGTDNYNDLNNKPSINGTTLSGNKSLDNLGIQAKLTFDSTPTEDSENPVESGGVYSALAGKQDTISDLSTIRRGAAAGATAVQPATLDTALAGKQDALSSEQLSAVNSGITSADVEQITTNKNNISLLDSKVGVKNILGITLSGLKAVNSGTWTSRAIVINGVTFTYNIDGTITADGTAGSSGANLYLYRHRNVADYNYVGATLTGCPSGGGAGTYGIFIEQESSPYGTFGADVGSGATIADKASRDSYGMITIKGTVSNITFSPMITHSSDLTFEPYSPTNRELYNDILTLQS